MAVVVEPVAVAVAVAEAVAMYVAVGEVVGGVVAVGEAVAEAATVTVTVTVAMARPVMGYDGAFDGRWLMGTNGAKAVIDVEKEAPSRRFRTWRLGWRVAESIFCPSSNGSHHKNHCNGFIGF